MSSSCIAHWQPLPGYRLLWPSLALECTVARQRQATILGWGQRLQGLVGKPVALEFYAHLRTSGKRRIPPGVTVASRLPWPIWGMTSTRYRAQHAALPPY